MKKMYSNETAERSKNGLRKISNARPFAPSQKWKKEDFPFNTSRDVCVWVNIRIPKKKRTRQCGPLLFSLVGRVTDTVISAIQSLQIKLTHVRIGWGEKKWRFHWSRSRVFPVLAVFLLHVNFLPFRAK